MAKFKFADNEHHLRHVSMDRPSAKRYRGKWYQSDGSKVGLNKLNAVKANRPLPKARGCKQCNAAAKLNVQTRKFASGGKTHAHFEGFK